MSAPVLFNMSGAISGPPISTTPASASWFYVMTAAIKNRLAATTAIRTHLVGSSAIKPSLSGGSRVTSEG